MKVARYSDAQIMGIFKQLEHGAPILSYVVSMD